MHWLLLAWLIWWIVSSFFLFGVFLYARVGFKQFVVYFPLALTFGWLIIPLVLLFILVMSIAMKGYDPY